MKHDGSNHSRALSSCRRVWRKSSRPPHAFTLIELLTVLLVIGVLSALLLPVLAKAKSSADQVRCGSNLRQLALAGQMSWDDNSGNAFRWRGAATNNGQIFWFGWLGNGAEGSRRFDPAFGALYPYLGSRGVEVCPAFNYSAPQFKYKAAGAAYGYGYDLALSAPASEPPINIAKAARPVELIFLGDAAQVNTFQAPASPENPMLEEFYYLNTTEATVHFRHRARANAVFCDGHVSAELPAPNSIDGRLHGQVIGRFRAELLSLQPDERR